MEVSAVIPTRDRPESLKRCLLSLAAQNYPLKEIIVVDASEHPLDARELSRRHPSLNLNVVRSKPSVCSQRNRGIGLTAGSHVLLSDDDIDFSPNYVAALVDFLSRNPECGAVSGVLVERSNGRLQETISQRITMPELCWRFFFQLTVWSDLTTIRAKGIGQLILTCLQNYYRRRNNTFTLAGWPLVTQVSDEYFRTAIFGLGAALVRRDWLRDSPYDEILDPHGIGDNYGVAIRFPGHRPITVLRSVQAIHHKSDIKRLSATTAYYRRILALDYFMKTSPKFTWCNRVFLVWSLTGNFLAQVTHFDFYRAYASCKAGLLICMCRNPYSVAARRSPVQSVSPDI